MDIRVSATIGTSQNDNCDEDGERRRLKTCRLGRTAGGAKPVESVRAAVPAVSHRGAAEDLRDHKR